MQFCFILLSCNYSNLDKILKNFFALSKLIHISLYRKENVLKYFFIKTF